MMDTDSRYQRVAKIYENLLDEIGTRDQEQIYTGQGNIEFGDRVWVVGRLSFSFESAPSTVDGLLAELARALVEYGTHSAHTDDVLETP